MIQNTPQSINVEYNFLCCLFEIVSSDLVQTYSESLTKIDCSYLAVVSEHLGDMGIDVMSHGKCGILR